MVPRDAVLVCRNYSRAYLHRLVAKDSSGAILLSYHNVHYMMRLMQGIREAIQEARFPEFVRNFLATFYEKEGGKIPDWVRNALKAADIDV